MVVIAVAWGKPWLKFYPADWQADELLGMCTLAARGLWIEMIGIMHKADPYGHLVVNGRPPTDTQLAALARCPPDQIPSLLEELGNAGVFSRTRTRVIYSRRMTRDERRSKDGRDAKITGTKVTGSRRHQAAKSGDNGEIIARYEGDIGDLGRQVTRCSDNEKSATFKVVSKVVDQPPSPQRLESRVQRETERIESHPKPSPNVRAPPGAGIDFEFAEFWCVYPRRDDRGHAVKAFKAARRKIGQEELVGSARRYAEARRGKEPKYTAMAASWLNGERWLDEAPNDEPQSAEDEAYRGIL